MTLKIPILLCILALPAGCVARAQPATSAPDLESQYRERLAAHAAAAAASPAPSIVSVATLGTEPFAPIDNRPVDPCPDGEMLWSRDFDVEICSRLCQFDDDCFLPEDIDGPSERCAVIDMGPPVDGQTIAWDEVEMPNGKIALGLCDPLWKENPTILALDAEEGL